MKFRCSSFMYRVRIATQSIIHGSKARWALCDERRRTITISPDVPPADRLNVLLHELTHAWIYHVGYPSNLESLCDLNGSILTAALRDLWTQGGEEALKRLSPGESPVGKAAVPLTRHRYCAKCQSTIAGASVVCLPSTLSGVVDLTLYCPHCSHLQRWREAVTCGGHPSGEAVDDASFERGEAVWQFLADYPQAGCGD